MDNQQQRLGDLPENAYRPLKDGEEYHPVMAADKVFPEVTPWSIFWGLLMAVIFSAAAAYSGLKIGQVIEAAIPISIIAVGAATFFKKKNMLGQNVIIQSIGASSGVIVAGAVFTIPALYILKLEVSFWHIFLSSLTGGFLGILFLIPFRKYFVKDMHGKFPFPEAKATTEILITGEKGGAQAGVLIASGLIGGMYDFLFSSVKLFGEKFTSNILPYGEMVADKYKMLFQLNISAMIVGFGYLVGLEFATIIAVGSMLAWFVFIPLINEIGNIMAAGGGTNIFAAMSAGEIFASYVRPIGIGAIATAGIIGIIKSSPVIGSAFKLAVGAGKKGDDTTETSSNRADMDLKMPFIIMFAGLTIVGVFIFLLNGFDITFSQAVVALLTVVIISFLFTSVAANAIAIVGSNPVSGMTLMTLILSSFILVQMGLSGEAGMTSVLIIGGIVCTALSMAGGFITDLKIGYWLGSTPVKQQSWKFLGTLVSAATVGLVIFILNQAYGFVETAATPNPMLAPQANAMAAIIQPLMDPNANISWMLYLVGGILAVLLNMIKISPLAFALGMYLPLELNTPLLVGGLMAYFLQKGKDKKLAEARHQRATLISSGYIAGAAIFGVVGAILLFFGINLDVQIFTDAQGKMVNEHGAEIAAFIAFAALVGFTIWLSMKAKADD